ncbi:DUF885 domain-containing protein [Mucilaginibacter sp. BJC16-A38]|uniref:DUF885 domain-containing protein n=1 Tax=Mucilaginibacter phenanthrenivorans TaxID=1234842 RepID=UPI0021584000|nr:DUF885 domain-containing protein [Mucilaginibacter phenanthrenivorans]MCR8557933.1 DUF885 domain-containing protein [Mucilaginibacter phenanthrenivorans]
MTINKNKAIYALAIGALALHPFAGKAQTENKDWIAKSNSYTKILIDLDKKYSPEFGSSQGLAYYDTLISVPTEANTLAQRKEREDAVAQLKAAKQKETDLKIKQDLDILINQSELGFRNQDFNRSKEVSFLNATSTVFGGLQSLLDDQTPVERRPAAVIRLNKYAGLQKGYQPTTELYKQLTLKQIAKPGMIYPSKQAMEVELSRDASMVAGIEELFKKYNITGYEQAYAAIKKQLEDYDAWVKATVQPKARTDFRLPPEEYKLALEGYGIDIPPAELAKMAHAAFTDIQNQMKPLAEQVAKKYNLPSSDYRAVIKFLKTKQIIGDSIMPIYKQHLADIETIIREQHLVTLPNRPAIIRLASEAETAQSPAPHMVPPPFLNNTGQRGVFVLPLNMPPAPGEKVDKYDDFTFDAASWTIIAHEARPGHELQFDKMVEEGVSQARALYAFNSTNVEGWGLYSEYISRPFFPAEGQLVSLDYRLLRAARAFLDPELQAGKVTQEQALNLLMTDVVQSHAFAQQEVQRYSLNAPGQANSYFYGFTKMIALRKDTEKALGDKFNQQHFHDFILSQGILPPALIREAVMGEFVGKEK